MKYLNTHLRGAIINAFIDSHKYFTYLEVGINDGVNFREISAISKYAVDPHWKKYPHYENVYAGSSDDFFKTNTKKFDVIFIDGLHTQEQVKKDIQNSLTCLNKNGTLFCHDICPAVASQCSAIKYPDGTIDDKSCWKEWVVMRQGCPDLTMTALSDGDWMGLIQKGKQDLIKIDVEIDFDNYLINRKRWLNLVTIKEYGKELTGFEWVRASYLWDKVVG